MTTARVPASPGSTEPASVPAREWQTITLSARESGALADAANLVTADPAHQTALFRTQTIAHGIGALSDGTRTKLEALASQHSTRPELLVLNLPPVPDLPPTPSTGQQTGSIPNTMSEFLLTVFSAPLGLPISYADQRQGRLTHDLYPTKANASAVSSQSSRVDLGHHSEMFFAPNPPDFLILHCLRADPDGKAMTGTASVEDIKASLSPGDIETLSQPLFAADLATLHGSYTYNGASIGQDAPRPVLPVFGDPSLGGRFRFEPELTTCTTAEAANAMANARRAADEATVYGHLQANSLVVLDNRRAVHSRTRFKARFDGTDRWIRRMMIGVETGFHERHDLELVKAWAATDSVLRTFPYPATHEEEVA